MDATCTLVGVIIFICCYYWYRRPTGSPPGPRGIPILGVLPFLGKYPERKIYEWSKSYGPIMSVRMATNDQVALNNYDDIMRALAKQPTVFSGRPHLPFFEEITQGHGLIFTDYGEKWRSQRKFGFKTLRGFGVGKKSLENRVSDEVAYLNDSIRSQNEEAFDIQILLKNAISNIICSVIMGRRFEYEDPRFMNIMKTIVQQFSDPVLTTVVRLLIFLPSLKWIPPVSRYHAILMRDIHIRLEMLNEIIQEHENTFDSKEMRDFIDAFINEKKLQTDPFFSNIQLSQYVRDLFIAGTETTSSTLSWALLCFLHYPQTQTKLREEVMETLGANGTISFDRKGEMPYTNAFIQELFRFRTLAPLSVPHMTNEDTEIGGYFIKKGTTILPNLWAAHNDPEFWDEPEIFKPERFLDEKGNFIPSNHVIPFSVGPRHCLGEQLARMEVFIFLVGMIQKFEFLPDPASDQLPDIEDGSNGPVFRTLVTYTTNERVTVPVTKAADVDGNSLGWPTHSVILLWKKFFLTCLQVFGNQAAPGASICSDVPPGVDVNVQGFHIPLSDVFVT